MPDRKPPQSNGDERSILHDLLQFQRESIVRKVRDVGDDDARRSVLASGTTLLWLIRHLAFAEHIWLVRRFVGEDETLVIPDPAADSLHAAVAGYEAMWVRSDAIIAGADLDQVTVANTAETPVSLRWIVAHLLEETARHAGHADILRELIDGETGR